MVKLSITVHLTGLLIYFFIVTVCGIMWQRGVPFDYRLDTIVAMRPACGAAGAVTMAPMKSAAGLGCWYPIATC
jgi:hypothetical protein